MSTTTEIQWTDASLNPWMGCTPVSAGCAHCYAEKATPVRVFGVKFGRGQERRPVATFEQEALRLNRKAWQQGRTYRVFPSLCDIFDDEVPVEMFTSFLDVVRRTPSLEWQVPTKRPQNFKRRLVAAAAVLAGSQGEDEARGWIQSWYSGTPPSNVWIGTSIEDQESADRRIPELLKIPARVRFLSIEPLLGSVDLSHVVLKAPGIDWAIVGGESGPKARPCDVLWIREVVAQCAVSGIPVFVKQLGMNPFQSPQHDNGTGYQLPIKHPKGGEPSEWPVDLRVRQFPVLRPNVGLQAKVPGPGLTIAGIRPTGKTSKGGS